MKALIVGSSGGIGSALVRALSDHDVHTVSRSQNGLDLEKPETLPNVLANVPSELDLIINATGVLGLDGHDPERRLQAIEADVMARLFAINSIGPALLLKHLQPKLKRRGRSVFANLSARLGSIGDNGLGGWTSYRASKAALNQIVRCAAIEIRRKRPESVVVSLHPGTIETDLTRPYARGRYTATTDEAARQLLDVLASLTPEDSGGFFDYAGKAIPF